MTFTAMASSSGPKAKRSVTKARVITIATMAAARRGAEGLYTTLISWHGSGKQAFLDYQGNELPWQQLASVSIDKAGGAPHCF